MSQAEDVIARLVPSAARELNAAISEHGNIPPSAWSENLPALPKGWVWTELQNITQINLGQSPPSSTYNENGNGLPFYQGKLEFGDTYPIPQKWCTAPKKIAEKGDVLISVRAPVGPTNICPERSCIGRGLAGIRGLGGIETLFMLYLMRAFQNFIADKGTGTTFNAITGDRLKGFEIPLPPLPEQPRIVAKIEELFTKLDAGVEALKKIKVQLKRYRQAVLRDAFRGKLTQEWREAHKRELEPASALLKRIKEERKKNARGNYKELPPLDTSDLPDLSEGWVWTTLEELAELERNAIKAGPFGSSLKKEFYVSNGYKIYGQEQVIREDPSYGDYYINDKRYAKLKSCAVKPGDMLISLVGTIGKVLVLPEAIEPGIINPRLVKFSLERRLVNNSYIKAYIESSTVRHFFSLSSHGGTMDILNLTILKRLPIPLPPLHEQHKIVEEIERRLSVADEIEKAVDHSLKQAVRLRQSILKRAFEGKLVSQDPADEPAERLLERIKEEKSKQQAKAQSPNKGRKTLKQCRLLL